MSDDDIKYSSIGMELSINLTNDEYKIEDFTNNEKIIGKFHAVMGSAYYNCDFGNRRKNYIYNYYKNMIKNIMDEIVEFKSVSFKQQGGERISVFTEGETYSQVFEKLKEYDVLDGVIGTLIDEDRNIIVLNIDDDFTSVNTSSYSEADREICKFYASISPLINDSSFVYLNNYQLYYYYRNRLEEIYEHPSSVKKIILVLDKKQNKIEIVDFTYRDIHMIINALYTMDTVKRISYTYALSFEDLSKMSLVIFLEN